MPRLSLNIPQGVNFQPFQPAQPQQTPFQAFVQFSFQGETFESEPVEGVPDEQNPEIFSMPLNYSKSIDVEINESFLNALVSAPLVVTLYELTSAPLPVKKGAGKGRAAPKPVAPAPGELQRVPMGTVSLDLTPLLSRPHAAALPLDWYTLAPSDATAAPTRPGTASTAPGSTRGDLAGGAEGVRNSEARIQMELQLDRPLAQHLDIDRCNVLNVSLVACCALPRAWEGCSADPPAAQPFAYTASLRFPFLEEPVVFGSGALVPQLAEEDPEAPQDLSQTLLHAHYHAAEHHRPRVAWQFAVAASPVPGVPLVSGAAPAVTPAATARGQTSARASTPARDAPPPPPPACEPLRAPPPLIGTPLLPLPLCESAPPGHRIADAAFAEERAALESPDRYAAHQEKCLLQALDAPGLPRALAPNTRATPVPEGRQVDEATEVPTLGMETAQIDMHSRPVTPSASDPRGRPTTPGPVGPLLPLPGCARRVLTPESVEQLVQMARQGYKEGMAPAALDPPAVAPDARAPAVGLDDDTSPRSPGLGLDMSRLASPFVSLSVERTAPQEPTYAHTGVAAIPLASLLRPGRCCIAGRYFLAEPDTPGATSRPHTAHSADESEQQQKRTTRANPKRGPPGKRGAGGGEKEDIYDDGPDAARLLRRARTYVIVLVSLERPLVPRAPALLPAPQRPLEVIGAARKEWIRATVGANAKGKGAESPGVRSLAKAFDTLIATIAATYTETAHGMHIDPFSLASVPASSAFSPATPRGASPPQRGTPQNLAVPKGRSALEGAEGQQDLERRVTHLLNTTGRYHQVKELLKRSVQKVVHEQFARTDQSNLVEFANDLYTHLLDRLHAHLARRFAPQSIPAPNAQPTATLSDQHLELLVAEARMNQDDVSAMQSYQELVARHPKDADLWYHYGLFCTLAGDPAKAEECLRRALVISPHHVAALLSTGLLKLGAPATEADAEPFLAAVVEHDPSHMLAWGILGAYYELRGRERDAMQAHAMAQQLLSSPAQPHRDAYRPAPRVVHPADPTFVAPSAPRPATLLQRVGQALIEDYGSPALALRSLEADLSNEPTPTTRVLLARAHLQRENLERAEEELRQALTADPHLADAWRWLGNTHYHLGRFAEAQQSYESASSLCDELVPDACVYVRLGLLYLNGQAYAAAKEAFLKACQCRESASAWLGLGVTCLRIGELIDAEQALSEANILHPFNAEVWGYLCVLCQVTNRDDEADRSFSEALKLDLNNTELLGEIAAKYLDQKKYHAAERACLRALGSIPEEYAYMGARIARILGDVHQEQGDSEQAIRWYQEATRGDIDPAEQQACLHKLAHAYRVLGYHEEAAKVEETLKPQRVR